MVETYTNPFRHVVETYCTEPEFLNFYGAQESILRNLFRQTM
jgi:hypothetical protein